MNDEPTIFESGPGTHTVPAGVPNCGFIFLEPRQAELALMNNATAPPRIRRTKRQVIGQVLFENLVAFLGRSSFSHVGFFAVGHDGIEEDFVWVDAATHARDQPAIHIRSLQDIPTDRKAIWIGYRHDRDIHRPGELCAHFVASQNDLTQTFGKAALVKIAWLRVISYLSPRIRGRLRKLADPGRDSADIFCSEFVAAAMVTALGEDAKARPGELWVPVDHAWLELVKDAVEESHSLYQRRMEVIAAPPPDPMPRSDGFQGVVPTGTTGATGAVASGGGRLDHDDGIADAYRALAVLAEPVDNTFIIPLDGLTSFDMEWSPDPQEDIADWMFDMQRDFGGGFAEDSLISRDEVRRWQPTLGKGTFDPVPSGFRDNILRLVRGTGDQDITWLKVGWRKGELPPFLVTPQHLYEHRGQQPED